MQIGKTLRKMRLTKGWTQQQLADAMHISRPCISKMENDEMTVEWDRATLWGQLTNCQDMLVALIYNVDVSAVQQFTDMIVNTPLVGTIIKWGGYIPWISIS